MAAGRWLSVYTRPVKKQSVFVYWYTSACTRGTASLGKAIVFSSVGLCQQMTHVEALWGEMCEGAQTAIEERRTSKYGPCVVYV